MPDALAMLALAKVSPMGPVAADAISKAVDEQFHIYSDQQDALLRNAKDAIISARSAILQAEAADASAGQPLHGEAPAFAPEVVHSSVGEDFWSAWTAWMDFTNRYFNCFKERRAASR
ncbi:unnamed protein product [Cladocopium goreaui]|uniref:Uncharacterized protein n=1 Tax=Cladocopium goreaui TaxID=2562237 RepID=A0A9P1BWC6_9DINO|nr:unnamed protein product [Cladocopium goreaui]|mmetsp:Transcript_29992/g.64660  ORF Transcript_29992/g.64660 Transcript_29992/m.64660 type:complete len:118 (+) Transcript_29992:55-408(+)